MSTPSWTSNQNNNGQTVDYDSSSNHQEVEENYGDSSTGSTRKVHKKASIVGGAAIAGTAAGLIIAGPLIAVVTGITAATLATQDTKAGAVARSTGDTVLCAQDQMRAVDKKLKIVEKTKWGVRSLFGKAKKIDEDHQIVDKTKRGVGNVVTKVKEVDERHGISFNPFRPKHNYTAWPDRD